MLPPYCGTRGHPHPGGRRLVRPDWQFQTRMRSNPKTARGWISASPSTRYSPLAGGTSTCLKGIQARDAELLAGQCSAEEELLLAFCPMGAQCLKYIKMALQAFADQGICLRQNCHNFRKRSIGEIRPTIFMRNGDTEETRLCDPFQFPIGQTFFACTLCRLMAVIFSATPRAAAIASSSVERWVIPAERGQASVTRFASATLQFRSECCHGTGRMEKNNSSGLCPPRGKFLRKMRRVQQWTSNKARAAGGVLRHLQGHQSSV